MHSNTFDLLILPLEKGVSGLDTSRYVSSPAVLIDLSQSLFQEFFDFFRSILLIQIICRN